MNNGRNDSVKAKIAARFNNDNIVAKRKNITFNISEELLERLDNVANVFNEKDGTTTRNAVIEEAVLGYIEEAEDYFERQNVHDDASNELSTDTEDFDTAVFPAVNDNFSKVFIGQHEWYYVRIAEWRISKLKYIALYRGTPVSAITHYAEIESIGQPNSDNKRIIKIKTPIQLTHPIELGDCHINNVRKLFYTTVQQLQQANTVKDLIK